MAATNAPASTSAPARPPKRPASRGAAVEEVRAYLGALAPAERAELERVRGAIRSVAPDAIEGMSYGMPTFKLDGKGIAGFAAFRNHLSLFPMSGSTLAALEDDLDGYSRTMSALHFTVDAPLPLPLIKKVVRARIAEMRGPKGR